MKSFFSILLALILFSVASHNIADNKISPMGNLCAPSEHSLQECLTSNEIESNALTGDANFSLLRLAKGKHNMHPYSKYSAKAGVTANRCGKHLKRITLLHNSIPAITISHRYILLIGKLII